MAATATTTGGLLRPVLHGTAWTAAAQVSDQLLRIAVVAIVARKLGPAEFGLAGMATAFSALGIAFADAAMGSAIVQRRELSDDDRSTAFWISFGFATLLGLTGVALSGAVAAFYGEPRVAGLFAAMSAALMIVGLGSTHAALLGRAMRFRALTLGAFAGQLAGAATGIGVALAGGGAWAIVAQGVASSVVSVTAYWIVMPWRPRLRFSRASFNDLGGFSLRLLTSRLFVYLQRYSDNLIVGRQLGSAALGAYALGYNLMMLPFQRVVEPLRNALYPALSRVQTDLPRLRGIWLRSTRAVAALFLPMLFGLIVVADDLVRVVLGDGWLSAVGPIRVLALVGVLQSAIVLNSVVLTALGRGGTLLRFSIAAFVLSLVGFLVGVQWGVLGVATGYLIATAAIVPAYVAVAARAIELPFAELRTCLGGVLQAALAMFAGVAALQVGLVALGTPPALRLAVCTVTGAALAAALLAWREPALRDDVKAALRARTA